MVKWIFVFLVVINLIFFAVMQWGGALFVDSNSPPMQAALNAEKIKIISQIVESSPIAVSAAVAALPVPALPAASKAPSTAKQSCMEWGEFSGADLQRAEKALAELSLADKLRRRQVDYVSGYWVYIAAMKTRAQADQKIAQLKERGVSDYFVIQEVGAWQNAISLGVFKTEEAAKKYLAKLQQQGVRSASIGERISKLKYTVFILSHLDAGLSSQVTALHKNFVDSELKSVSCN